MNFELDDEQHQLRDSLTRLLADHCSFEQRRAIVASPAGTSPALWKRLCEMGVTGLVIPEADGGLGGSAVDLMSVMQACGGALLPEPVLASSVLGAKALVLAAGEAMRQRLLPAIATGDVLVSWAHDERGARHATTWIETHATQKGDGWRITGGKTNVLHGATAQHLVVSARVAGTPGDSGGRALFLVDAAAAGLTLRAHRLVDDTAAAEVTLRDAPALPLGNPFDDALQGAAIAGTQNFGMAAVCADMLGAMESAFGLAMEYLNTRKQFGRLIGENQALRHKAAEMLVSLEICRSMAMAAAVAVDRPSAEDSAADVLRAKLLLGRHGRLLCRHAIQIHGGIGMTEEYAVGHMLRRVHVMDQLFGDSETQASRLADLMAA